MGGGERVPWGARSLVLGGHPLRHRPKVRARMTLFHQGVEGALLLAVVGAVGWSWEATGGGSTRRVGRTEAKGAPPAVPPLGLFGSSLTTWAMMHLLQNSRSARLLKYYFKLKNSLLTKIPSGAELLAKLQKLDPKGDVFGGSTGNRTQNQWLKRPLLYRLSYRPEARRKKDKLVWTFLIRARVLCPRSGHWPEAKCQKTKQGNYSWYGSKREALCLVSRADLGL